jgi:hypothetical protein
MARKLARESARLLARSVPSGQIRRLVPQNTLATFTLLLHAADPIG